MTYFVQPHSIVKQIWGKSDTILFIFAGAPAEFALNKAVDWLYYTGKLPRDPLARLFSTVAYARSIVFSSVHEANQSIDRIASIHSAVEENRGSQIPDWAYRDVLFMLIDYSIRSFEVLERTLTTAEKEEVFDVFYRVGKRMGLQGLPHSFESFEVMRKEHLENDLQKGHYTVDLFKQYRKHLGFIRYVLLIQTQHLLVPDHVRNYLGFKHSNLLKPLIKVYQLFRTVNVDWILKELLLPSDYKKQIQALDQFSTT